MGSYPARGTPEAAQLTSAWPPIQSGRWADGMGVGKYAEIMKIL